jgi:hypothetical protein
LPEDLLFVPDTQFFRQRGIEEIALMPYDVHGTLLTENGKPISGEKYIEYLGTVLPSYYITGKEFRKYTDALLGRERPLSGSYGW